MDAGSQPLERALEALQDTADGQRLSVGELLDAFEDRSLGLIMAVFGLAVALPVIGAIPGLPGVAAIVVLVAVFHNLIGGRQRFWAPDALRRRTVEAEKVRRLLERTRPAARWVDGLLVNRRLSFLAASWPARLAIALTGAALAVAMGLMAFVPGLGVPPALGITLLGLALMGRDGLFALLGYIFVAVTGGAALYAFNGLV